MAYKKTSYSKKTAAGKISPRKRMAGYSMKKSSMKKGSKNKYES